MSNVLDELKRENLVIPDYKNSNFSFIKDIYEENSKSLSKKGKKIILIIDGLGYDLLDKLSNEHRELKDIISNSKLIKVTTVAPSSTAPVLSSLDSGLSVAEHGVVGMTMPVKGAGLIIDTLKLSPAASPHSGIKLDIAEKIFPVPESKKRFSERHKSASLVNEAISNSGYSKISIPKSDFLVSFKNLKDMILKLAEIIKKDERNFIYVYYDNLDNLEHKNCPNSKEVRNEVLDLFGELKERILPLLSKHEYSLFVTADHGQIGADSKDAIRIYDSDKLIDFLTLPPWDGPRITFFSVDENKFENFEEEWHKKTNNRFLLYESNELIRAEIFGKNIISDSLRYRFGTHIAIPKDRCYINYVYTGTKAWELGKYGCHGGMSEEEMYVPIMVFNNEV